MKNLILLFCVMSVFAFAEDNDKKEMGNKWDSQNNPYRINPNFESTFKALPLSGDMSSAGLGWPGYFWAKQKAGITQRWQVEQKRRSEHFKYDVSSVYQLKNMTQAQRDLLSPAEKYDIFMGNYSYPTVEKVRNATSPRDNDWSGICHGVSPAGLHHKEPAVKAITNKDGITITFFSSDLKALVAYYYAKVSDSGITQIGKRCFLGKRMPFRGKGCNDVNPAALHIIMANRLGITKNGFIADIDRFKQVWNHVAVKFESKVLKYTKAQSGSAPGTYRSVQIESVVHYTGGVEPKKLPILGTENAKWDLKTYKYTLDLDVKGKIIGGSWDSKQRPDFLWVKDKETFEDNYYGPIQSLL